jgi:hypothetical protein
MEEDDEVSPYYPSLGCQRLAYMFSGSQLQTLVLLWKLHRLACVYRGRQLAEPSEEG